MAVDLMTAGVSVTALGVARYTCDAVFDTQSQKSMQDRHIFRPNRQMGSLTDPTSPGVSGLYTLSSPTPAFVLTLARMSHKREITFCP